MIKKKDAQGCIYKLTNFVNGEAYVGKTIKPLAVRWAEHVRAAKHGSSYALHRAIRKYGEDAFGQRVLKYVDRAQLNAQEIFFIKKYHTFTGDSKYAGGYNLMPGGEGGAMGGAALKHWRAVMASSAHRALQSARSKAAHAADPTLSGRKVQHFLGHKKPGHGARMSQLYKGRKSPVAEQVRLRKLNADHVASGQTSEWMKRWWATPGVRDAVSARAKQYCIDHPNAQWPDSAESRKAYWWAVHPDGNKKKVA